MLQPKRTKFRKQQKGRNRGKANVGSKVSFGDFGLKATTRGRLTARQIEAARRAITRHVKRGANSVFGEDDTLMDANELRAKSAEDLERELLELSREAFNLRMQKGTGQLTRHNQVKDVRRSIARVKTILNERRRAESK